MNKTLTINKVKYFLEIVSFILYMYLLSACIIIQDLKNREERYKVNENTIEIKMNEFSQIKKQLP